MCVGNVRIMLTGTVVDVTLILEGHVCRGTDGTELTATGTMICAGRTSIGMDLFVFVSRVITSLGGFVPSAPGGLCLMGRGAQVCSVWTVWIHISFGMGRLVCVFLISSPMEIVVCDARRRLGGMDTVVSTLDRIWLY